MHGRILKINEIAFVRICHETDTYPPTGSHLDRSSGRVVNSRTGSDSKTMLRSVPGGTSPGRNGSSGQSGLTTGRHDEPSGAVRSAPGGGAAGRRGTGPLAWAGRGSARERESTR